MLIERTNNLEQTRLERLVETINVTRVRRCVGSDAVLVVVPDVRGEIAVAMVRERELRGYRALQAAILQQTWPPQIIGREQWQAVRARL